MAVSLKKSNLVVEYNGAKFMYRPRNANTVAMFKENVTALDLAKTLIVGWDGVLDEDQKTKVEFKPELLGFLDIDELSDIVVLIAKEYGIEAESEGN